MLFPLTSTCFLVILMNIQLSHSAEVQKIGHLHVGGGDGYLANILHYVIKHEGSIKHLETKIEKQEEKHAEDMVKLENELENKHEYGKLERKHAEDMNKMKKIHADDLIKLQNDLETKLANSIKKIERKHDEDMSKMKKIHADDLIRLQNNLETKHDADINTLKKKHGDDLIKLQNDLETKHDADINTLQKINADDLVKLKNDLETKLANSVKKIERKHDGDIKKLMSRHADDMNKLEYKQKKHNEDLKNRMSDIEALQKKTHTCPFKLPVHWRGHCYGLFHITLTWQRAQDYCQSVGANLVWIEDEAEQKFVTLKFSPKKVRIWLGCNDITHEGRFVWVHNNQRVSYSKWAPIEPNNDGGMENCCEMGYHDIGLWNDELCDDKIENFICKT